jgi:hypothetical protein
MERWPSARHGVEGEPFGMSWDADRYTSLPVRCLLVDGLHVPPFDRHRGGDGRLRAVGLDAPSWQHWIDTVVRQRCALEEGLRGAGFLGLLPFTGAIRYPRGLGNPNDPVRALGGTRALRNEVARIWKEAKRRGGPTESYVGLDRRALFQEFSLARPRPPHLHVRLVEYPVVVAAVFPPSSVLVGAPASASTEERMAAVRHGFRQLCALVSGDQ